MSAVRSATLSAALAGLLVGCGSSSPADPCQGVTCSFYGICISDGLSPFCSCMRGYHPEGLGCVLNDGTDPCLGVTCNAHGMCRVADDMPVCDCAPGYAPDESGLLCFAGPGHDAGPRDGGPTDAPPFDGGVDAPDAAADGGADAAENRPPSFVVVPGDQSLDACTELRVMFEAEDPDGDGVTLSSPDLPPGATLDVMGGMATLTWIPAVSDVGVRLITIVATDDRTPPAEMSTRLRVEVRAPPAAVLEPVPDQVVIGGADVMMAPGHTTHACYTLSVEDMPAGATFDADSGTFAWTTTPDDLGVYDVTFVLSDGGSPPMEVRQTARITVQFEDGFSTFTGYTSHEVYWPGCCSGPVTWTAEPDLGTPGDHRVVHSHSDRGVDVIDYMHRAFDRTAVPLSGLAWEVEGRDVVVGTACGSGGFFMVLDTAVTDPDATWPGWLMDPEYASTGRIPDSVHGADAGFASFAAPTRGVTAVLNHGDGSNICTVDVYWDRLFLSPVPMGDNRPPAFTSVAAPGLTPACAPFSASFEAVDPDGDPVTYTSPDLPPGATLRRMGTTVILDWTPTQSQVGLHTVTIEASDDGTPPLTGRVMYPIDVTGPPPLALDVAPASTTLIGGEHWMATATAPSHACFTLSATGLPRGATFDPGTGVASWDTTPDDFGIYDVTFHLRDSAPVPAEMTRTSRVIVQYRDDFTALTGYTHHEVYWPGCCAGPVTWTAVADGTAEDGQAVQSHSNSEHDVEDYTHRVFNRSAVPYSGVMYSLRARDVVVGPACGSGGWMKIYGAAVTDPSVTWPGWVMEPTYAVTENVPDNTYAEVSGTATLAAPSRAITLLIKHGDGSNVCTIDVYWDRVMLTPIP